MINRRSFLATGLSTLSAGWLLACNSSGESTGGAEAPSSSSSADSPASPPESASSFAALSCALGKPAAIDPAAITDAVGLVVAYQLFDCLTDYNENNELFGLCASSWEANDAGTEFTFRLRQGITFHNGEVVTASSFKAAWERLAAPREDGTAWPNAGRLSLVVGYDELAGGLNSGLTGVTASDDFTLVVRLKEPCFDFPSRLVHPAFAPIPETADLTEFSLEPVGNGPFLLRGPWDGEGDIRLKANSSYYGGSAGYGGLTFVAASDPAASWGLFQTGKVDVSEIPAERAAAALMEYGRSEDGYHAKDGSRVLTGVTLHRLQLVVNLCDPQLSDVHLRHALSLAVDRARMCEVELSGKAVSATGLVPPQVAGDLDQVASWADARHDIDAATRLLNQYYPLREGSRGLVFTLLCSSGSEQVAVAQGLAADFAAVGVSAEVKPVSQSELVAGLKGAYQLALVEEALAAPTWDAGTSGMLEACLVSGSSVESLLNRARSEKDDKKRPAAFAEASAALAQDMPLIPLAFMRLNLAVGEKVAQLYVDERGCPSFVTASLS